MNVLVVYAQTASSVRNTVTEHLKSFQKYSKNNVIYHDAFYGTSSILKYFDVDLVIYHYTFLAQRWNGKIQFRAFLERNRALKNIGRYRVAMPQDEYVNSDILSEFCESFNIDQIFTCFDMGDAERVYNEAKVKGVKLTHTLTGFVDDEAKESLRPMGQVPHIDRKIDIGYRARKLPYWLGEHGTLKWRLTEAFLEKSNNKELVVDLSNNEADVFKGADWYKFLSSCRVVLGCEGGASLWDPNGAIKAKVDEYVKANPGSSFEEVESNCFAGLDNNINLFAISPRHFEACITKTCQAMVEGTYEGIFEPDVHYISIKKDFSNIDEVLEKIEDVQYCQMIANRAYEDIALNHKYSFSYFVESFFKNIEGDMKRFREKETGESLLPIRYINGFLVFNKLTGFYHKTIYFFKKLLFPFLKNTKFIQVYRQIRGKIYG